MKFWQSLLNEILAESTKDEDEILTKSIECKSRECEKERINFDKLKREKDSNGLERKRFWEITKMIKF